MLRILKTIAMILPYVFVFIFSLYLPTDPDLGWHLKYGEYFFQHHQLLTDNIFSTMMPNYHWINGTWGTDIITYAIYHTSGFFGLSLAAAGIVTLTFFFFAKAGKLDFLSKVILFPLFIYLLSPVNNPSFRGQQMSYLFLGILIFILSKYKSFSKLFFCIPLLFLFWVNIHEEAFLFLTLFGAWVVFVLIRNSITIKRSQSNLHENLFLLGIFLLSCLVTFINPFGTALQDNALSYFGNPLVKNISEYEPYPMLSLQWWNQITATLLLIVYLIGLFRKKQIGTNFPVICMSALLLLFGFEMRRYLWPAYYLMLSFLFIPTGNLKKYRDKYATVTGIVLSLVAIGTIIQFKLPFSQFTTMSWKTYCTLQAVPCSPTSAEFLEKHKLTNNIFSYYDWGGWLIWNYPNIKPSIDGRMTEWRDANGYSASDDYYEYINAQKNIDTSPYNVVYLPNDQSPLALEVSTLIQQKKWKAVYSDENAGIAVRLKKK